MRLSNQLARLPRPTPLSAAELALMALVAVQAARLFWALLTPLGPVGEWQPTGAALVAAPDSALGDFDPFFRLNAAGPVLVTSLDLKLFGVREDRATGRGSAIIALPDGRQSSFAVGEEILAGVRLAEVGFDSVTIDHQGRREQIFLDQSTAAETIGGTAPGPQAPSLGQAGPSVAAPALRPAPAAPPPPPGQPVQFQPRMTNGRLTGIAVSPGMNDQTFRAAGFAPGDVIIAVEGQPVQSVDQVRGQIAGARTAVTITVDRGGRAVPMRVRLNP